MKSRAQLMIDDLDIISRQRLNSVPFRLEPTSNGPEYALAIEWLEAGLTLVRICEVSLSY